jgi:hypothetical protein
MASRRTAAEAALRAWASDALSLRAPPLLPPRELRELCELREEFERRDPVGEGGQRWGELPGDGGP